jgi:hypothetical protein
MQVKAEQTSRRFAKAYQGAINVNLQKKYATTPAGKTREKQLNQLRLEKRLEQAIPKRTVPVLQNHIQAGNTVTTRDQRSDKANLYMWIVPDDAFINISGESGTEKFMEIDSRARVVVVHDQHVTLEVLYAKKFGKMPPSACKRLRKARAIVAALAAKRAALQMLGV